MKRYIDAGLVARMARAKADTLIEGKEAFFAVAKWLDLLPAADAAFEVLEEVRTDLCNTFIDMCGGNDYNKLTLLQIYDVIDATYEKHLEDLNKYREDKR